MSINDLLNTDLTVIGDYLSDLSVGLVLVVVPMALIAYGILKARDKWIERKAK